MSSSDLSHEIFFGSPHASFIIDGKSECPPPPIAQRGVIFDATTPDYHHAFKSSPIPLVLPPFPNVPCQQDESALTPVAIPNISSHVSPGKRALIRGYLHDVYACDCDEDDEDDEDREEEEVVVVAVEVPDEGVEDEQYDDDDDDDDYDYDDNIVGLPLYEVSPPRSRKDFLYKTTVSPQLYFPIARTGHGSCEKVMPACRKRKMNEDEDDRGFRAFAMPSTRRAPPLFASLTRSSFSLCLPPNLIQDMGSWGHSITIHASPSTVILCDDAQREKP